MEDRRKDYRIDFMVTEREYFTFKAAAEVERISLAAWLRNVGRAACGMDEEGEK